MKQHPACPMGFVTASDVVSSADALSSEWKTFLSQWEREAALFSNAEHAALLVDTAQMNAETTAMKMKGYWGQMFDAPVMCNRLDYWWNLLHGWATFWEERTGKPLPGGKLAPPPDGAAGPSWVTWTLVAGVVVAGGYALASAGGFIRAIR